MQLKIIAVYSEKDLAKGIVLNGYCQVVLDSKNQKIEGMFTNGQLDGPGKMAWDDTFIEEGAFRKGMLDLRSVDPSVRVEMMGQPQFVQLVTGLTEYGSNPGYIIPILCSHFNQIPWFKQNYDHLAQALNYVSELNLQNRTEFKEGVLKKLETSQEILLPYGKFEHAMLVGLRFKADGLYADVYNSGDGLLEYHTRSLFVRNKFQTCLTYFFLGMSCSSKDFEPFLDSLIKFKDYKSKYDTYSPFLRAKKIEDNSVFHAQQKGGNCTLECVMAFLKKNMDLRDYEQYRIQLIGDTRQRFQHNNSLTLDQKVTFIERLDTMLERRTIPSKLSRFSDRLTTFIGCRETTHQLSKWIAYSDYRQQIMDHPSIIPKALSQFQMMNSLKGFRYEFIDFLSQLVHQSSVEKFEELLPIVRDIYENRSWQDYGLSEQKFLFCLANNSLNPNLYDFAWSTITRLCSENTHFNSNHLDHSFMSQHTQLLRSDNPALQKKILEAFPITSCNFQYKCVAHDDFLTAIATLYSSNDPDISTGSAAVISSLSSYLAWNNKLATNKLFFAALVSIIELNGESIRNRDDSNHTAVQKNLINIFLTNPLDDELMAPFRTIRGAAHFPSLYQSRFNRIVLHHFGSTSNKDYFKQELIIYYGHLKLKQRHGKAHIILGSLSHLLDHEIRRKEEGCQSADPR